MSATQRLIATLSPVEQARIMGGTAAEVYRLAPVVADGPGA